MKNHLKRLAAPPSWKIDRKLRKFIIRSKPGPHSLSLSLPLGLIIRDLFQIAKTRREVKKLLNNKIVLVDGKRRKDYRLPVGLFDVVSLPEVKENYRVIFNKKGQVMIKAINSEEASLKPCKITGKKKLSKNIQLNLHDGRNLLVENDFKGKIGDTVLLSLADNKIKSLLELKKEAFVYLIQGKRSGDYGHLKEIKGETVVYLKDDQEIETLKNYLFVLGDKKPVIEISEINIK